MNQFELFDKEPEQPDRSNVINFQWYLIRRRVITVERHHLPQSATLLLHPDTLRRMGWNEDGTPPDDVKAL
ncbi:MAG: hypothetical protein COB78_09965 [Hyphomicrobiales bacterium]|nr:MAG: hypothetical protein COB78_09965 [Hyphomicrobiales bacterium]